MRKLIKFFEINILIVKVYFWILIFKKDIGKIKISWKYKKNYFFSFFFWKKR